jgi:hypothetical protein
VCDETSTRFVVTARLVLLVGVAFAALPVGSALADTTVGQVGSRIGFLVCTGSVVLGHTNHVAPTGGGVIDSFSIQGSRVREMPRPSSGFCSSQEATITRLSAKPAL